MENLSLGIDFGTDSARAVLVGAGSGKTVYSCLKEYGRWKEGKYCRPDESEFHQHPLDYIETLEFLLGEVARNCPDKSALKAIAVDSTCSTPCIVGADCQPLALKEAFRENPGAMFVLWKDKSGCGEALEIKRLLSAGDVPYMKHCGNSYSAEFTWAKILHQLRSYPEIRSEARGFIEEVDFITALLCGKPVRDIKACNAPAIIKGLWSPEWGGFPREQFARIDETMALIAANSNYCFCTPGTRAGTLSREYAEKYGFGGDVVISVGAIDSHSGVIGSGAGENTLAMSVGTSACFWLNYKDDSVSDLSPDGLVGDADSIMVEGARSTGVGLSAFGDVFAWFRNLLCWGRDGGDGLVAELSEAAASLPLNEDSVLSTDHFNGRRSPFANDSIRASISGLSLSSTAPEVFRSLVEAVCFAAKASIDQLLDKGIRIDSYRAVGGVSRKSPYVMQTLADVLGHPVSVCDYDDSGARGAAVFGAVASGLYGSVAEAQARMTSGCGWTYVPRAGLETYFRKRYEKYQALVAFNENN